MNKNQVSNMRRVWQGYGFRGLTSLVVMFLFMVVFAASAAASTWTVGASGQDFITIQGAIDSSDVANGDTIVVVDSVHTEEGIVVDKDVTIQGYGAESTIVQGNMSDGVFEIASCATVNIELMSIRNGYQVHFPYKDGGGINNAGTLTLTGCNIDDNYGSNCRGGGIYNVGILTLADCNVRDNLVQGRSRGGGIYNAGTMHLTNCAVSDNSSHKADYGGGGIANLGDMTLTNCTVAGNISDYDGGGINNEGDITLVECTVTGNETGWDADGAGIHNSGTLTLTGCNIDDNRSQSSGGGISNNGTATLTSCNFNGNNADWGSGGGFFNNGTSTLTGCNFNGNSTYGDGGGIYNTGALTLAGCNIQGNRVGGKYWGGGIYNSGTMDLSSCTVNDNEATSGGYAGGIANRGAMTLTNCIVARNRVDLDGGGINNEGDIILTNCTITGNNADRDGGLYGYGTVTNCIFWDNSPDQIRGSPSVTYSNVQGGWTGEGNIDEDPMFVDPDNGDYDLQPGSPCINAGTPVGAPADDIEGNPRDGSPDMGAYEGEASTEIEADIDIQPDTLNLKSKGKWITCYIELPAGYDVNNIAIASILFDGAVAAEPNPLAIGDYDSDAIADLMVKFDRSDVQDLLEPADEVEVTVSGDLDDGTSFVGSDTIRVIDKGKK